MVTKVQIRTKFNRPSESAGPLLNRSQAAKELGVSPLTFDKYFNENNPVNNPKKNTVKIGKRRFYIKDTLDKQVKWYNKMYDVQHALH